MEAAMFSPVDIIPTPKSFAGQKAVSRADIEKTAKDFEAVFMGQMLKPMWADIKTDEIFGGGAGEDVMREMLVQEYGKAMVGCDGGLLSRALVRDIIRMQEQADTTATTHTQG